MLCCMMMECLCLGRWCELWQPGGHVDECISADLSAVSADSVVLSCEVSSALSTM